MRSRRSIIVSSTIQQEPPWYGTVCPVVWEDGGSNPASYPMPDFSLLPDFFLTSLFSATVWSRVPASRPARGRQLQPVRGFASASGHGAAWRHYSAK